MKKRYFVILFVIGLIALSFVPFISPVRPFIQLPGEVWPGTQDWPFFGTVLGGMTNTFASALVAWLVSYGRHAFLYPLFYRLLPGWNLFQGQERAA